MNEQQKQVMIGAAFVLVIIVVGLGLAMVSGSSDTSGTATTPITANDHIRGTASSSVTVIEYGDFECPACGVYEPIVQKLEAKYGDRVTFAFRQFPLYQIHQNAMISAQATEAASNQGKFWEMHDILYKNQSEWVDLSGDALTKMYDSYATSLGLDVDKFNADLIASSTVATVMSQLSLGEQAQIDHTPTFFINLKPIKNPSSYDAFAYDIDSALTQKH